MSNQAHLFQLGMDLGTGTTHAEDPRETRAQYDGALSSFAPEIQAALRARVEARGIHLAY